MRPAQKACNLLCVPVIDTTDRINDAAELVKTFAVFLRKPRAVLANPAQSGFWDHGANHPVIANRITQSADRFGLQASGYTLRQADLVQMIGIIECQQLRNPYLLAGRHGGGFRIGCEWTHHGFSLNVN